MEKKKKGKFSVTNLLLVILLITGIGIFLYPSFSDWYNSLHQSYAITDYTQAVENNGEEENRRMFQEARSYNQHLAETGISFSEMSEEEKQNYNSLLDVSGTGIMGYIDVDKVHIHLPIYHDTTEGVLQIAVGHLAGTSLPVGGNSSHCVLTGHTGLPSSRLFTDIDQLKKGDTFQITTLNYTLTYEVNDIRTVLPDELDSLQIEEGRDLVTLVTCTPYGINTHRLLVTGTRIPNPPGRTVSSQDLKNALISRILGPAALILTALIILVLILKVRQKKKMNRRRR